jgi:hypothetical protein
MTVPLSLRSIERANLRRHGTPVAKTQPLAILFKSVLLGKDAKGGPRGRAASCFSQADVFGTRLAIGDEMLPKRALTRTLPYVTITDIEEAIGNDRGTPLTFVLESGLQLALSPETYGKTKNGELLFVPLEGRRFAIVETTSVKTILK